MDNGIERREFIKQSIVTGVTVAAAGANILGANDRIRVGVIGPGRQGRGVMKTFMKNPDVQVVAVCDVYASNLDFAIKDAKLEGAQTYKDFRQILDRKDVDAVIVASPDHWHALQTVMACQAGKDVYVEKPISTTVDEGRKMVQAARKYNRVVQVGTQQRSGDHYQKAAEIIRSGQIGKVTFIRTWNFGNQLPDGIGAPPDTNPPDGLDWDMWLGPAPMRPFNQNRFGVHPDRWSSFRWFWDYAGGMMTDWGVHHLDIVQMVMQVDAPTAITAMGGKYALKDNRETPDTLMVTYEYPGFVCTYEDRECNGHLLNGEGYGILFHGADATLYINRQYFDITPEKGRKIEAQRVKAANKQGDAHIRNFLDCVKSRQTPISDIEIGHRSTSTCLLGNVALRSGHRIAWDAKAEKIAGDNAASKYLSREYRKPWKLNA
ncbi:MAG: Inositol 2-dehydrogenase/D-chiro-inositol 3-dehydrogenase [Acidobacteria bacterium]|nr:Inositol 2-dehydrogenase/D-chiro-inositol 3-dehydrogenase [Acidobacteriota bacterium]